MHINSLITGPMQEDLQRLYQEIIMAHNRHPHHYEKVEKADLVLEAYNPLCGDRFTMYLRVAGEEITEAHFHGYGCAISKASTSVLVKRLEGTALSALISLCKEFENIVDPDAPPPGAETDQEMLAFEAARHFPARKQCAILSWERLRKYLEKEIRPNGI